MDKLPEERKAGAEYYLTLELQLKSDTLYAKAGHVVAQEQFLLPETLEHASYQPAAGNVEIQDEDGGIAVNGSDFSFTMDKESGMLRDYTYRGTLLMSEGPVPNFYRAPLNNDGSHDKEWKSAANNPSLKDYEIEEEGDGRKIIRTTLSFPEQPGLYTALDYTIGANGAVTVQMTTDATSTSLGNYLRIGTNMRLPGGYENITWYGDGPVESMSDRNNFAVVSRYQSTVSEMFYPYLDTQDTGTLPGTKWFTVTDPDHNEALVVAAHEGFKKNFGNTFLFPSYTRISYKNDESKPAMDRSFKPVISAQKRQEIKDLGENYEAVFKCLEEYVRDENIYIENIKEFEHLVNKILMSKKAELYKIEKSNDMDCKEIMSIFDKWERISNGIKKHVMRMGHNKMGVALDESLQLFRKYLSQLKEEEIKYLNHYIVSACNT